MESIEQNPVYYDLAFEMPLHKDEVNIEEWLCRYADRRYGKPSENAHQAWLHLLEGPYRPGTNGTERSSIIAARPAVNVKIRPERRPGDTLLSSVGSPGRRLIAERCRQTERFRSLSF